MTRLGAALPPGELLWVLGAVAAATGLVWLVEPFVVQSDRIMIFLLAIVGVAWRTRLVPSLLAAGLSVAAFNFFFVPPRFTFYIEDYQYIITFSAMGLVGMLLSGLASQLKHQRAQASAREARTEALYALSRTLQSAAHLSEIATFGATHLARSFGGSARVWLRAPGGGDLEVAAEAATSRKVEARELHAAHEAAALGEPVALSSPQGGPGLALPLLGSAGPLGAITLRHAPGMLEDAEQRALLEAFVGQIAIQVARESAREERQLAEIGLATERLRANLLSTVSHDLRTPLGTILGAAGTLLHEEVQLTEASRLALLQSIWAESERLERLVRNLLEMTRVTAGAVRPRLDWHAPEEVIGAALARLDHALSSHPVEIAVETELGCFDATLIELALLNLLENAVRYSPPGAPIEVRAWSEDATTCLEVRDHGPGVAPEEAPKLFEKFYRGKAAQGVGSGLGLAICLAAAEVHGGSAWAQPRADGLPGASFGLRLPCPALPPLPTAEAEDEPSPAPADRR